MARPDDGRGVPERGKRTRISLPAGFQPAHGGGTRLLSAGLAACEVGGVGVGVGGGWGGELAMEADDMRDADSPLPRGPCLHFLDQWDRVGRVVHE